MMRTSLWMGGLVAVMAMGCSVSTTDNSITFKTKTKFEASNASTLTYDVEWTGQPIVINDDGVNPATGDTGLTVVAGADTTRVSLTAKIVSFADVEADAQLAIKDVQDGLKIEEKDGKIVVTCGHGQAHGSADQAGSGCDKLTVNVPAGSLSKPMDLTVGLGIGDLNVSGVVGTINAKGNGVGDVDVNVTPTKGSTVDVEGEGAVVVRLPYDFSADVVNLSVDDSASVDTADFPGIVSGQAYGTVGQGASRVSAKSNGILSSDTVTLKKQ